MKKVLLLVIVLSLLMTSFTFAHAQEPTKRKYSTFNLIDYLDQNEITSKEELENLLVKRSTFYQNNVQVSRSREVSKYDTIEEFNIEVDSTHELVYVSETVSYREQASKENSLSRNNKAVTTVYTRSTRDVYSALGIKLYTVEASGIFEYDGLCYVNVTEPEGYFTPALASLFESNCWIDHNNQGENAYVKVYGTAISQFSISYILGITLTFSTCQYSLKINCDETGRISTTWSNSSVF